jgi:predicted nucleic acid-binding Zn ribbon protein
MPLFDYECSCGAAVEEIVGINEAVYCAHCGRPMKRLMPSQVHINMGVPWTGYYDETLGKHITSNRQRREECIKQGVTPKGDTPRVYE